MVAHDLEQLITEAAANAARQGGVTSMAIAIEVHGSALAIAIEDDRQSFTIPDRPARRQPWLRCWDREVCANGSVLRVAISASRSDPAARDRDLAAHGPGAAGMTIHLVLVDDHPVVLEGIARLIEHEPDLAVMARCTDGSAALEAVRAHRPTSWCST